MSESLKDFGNALQESLLTLLWRQWCICGVQGHAPEPAHWCIDPEILILLTCSVGRREPRMFDEMLEWLRSMHGLINLQRLKTIINSSAFIGGNVLKSVAGYLDGISGKGNWTKAIGIRSETTHPPAPLFAFKDGRDMESFGNVDPIFKGYGFLRGPVEHRGLVGPFDLRHPACLPLRLRSFLGTTSRSAICAYLCTHAVGPGENPTRIARETGHAQRAVQNTLTGMGKSGYITRHVHAREILYAISPELKHALLHDVKSEPLWCNWMSVGGFLEKTWLAFDDKRFVDADPMIQSIRLREVVEQYTASISRSGLPVMLNLQGHLEGGEYVQWVMEKVNSMIKILITGEPGSPGNDDRSFG